jgi:hypothetical protein
LDVVVLYAFDCTESTPDWHRVNEVYWMVQSKLAQFPDSCLSYLYVRSGSNSYTKEKRVVGGKNILPETTLGCDKDMASGLPEAESLISLSSKNPNGIILLFSDGSINNKGDFFDKAEDYVPKVPVYTFTLGSDAYNQVRLHIYIACACVRVSIFIYIVVGNIKRCTLCRFYTNTHMLCEYNIDGRVFAILRQIPRAGRSIVFQSQRSGTRRHPCHCCWMASLSAP